MAGYGSGCGSCGKGVGRWDWASNEGDHEPQVVMACCGDVPTLEVLAAVSILRTELPELRIRVINVVDLMTLQPQTEHPHGLNEKDFLDLFTLDKPVVFAFHGYPWLIHRLIYRHANSAHFHVRGYKEEGTTTTPFDMTVLNDLDRFHLVMDVMDRVSLPVEQVQPLRQQMENGCYITATTSANMAKTCLKFKNGAGHFEPVTGHQQRLFLTACVPVSGRKRDQAFSLRARNRP